MLNKLLLNNQIISNKKKIHKGRTQIINKLVQKIRKLKELSTKYPDKANLQANLERIPLILACVKKFKAADIIRRVLTFPKKPTAVLTNGLAKPEDVAIALLASNKIIDSITSPLRLALHLNDSNPGWEKEIMELSRKKRAILKSGERKKLRKSASGSMKSSLKSKLTWKEEDVEHQSTKNPKTDESAPQTNGDGWKVEPVVDILESAAEPVTKPPKSLSKLRKESLWVEPKQKKSNSKLIEEQSLTNEKSVTTIDSFFFTTTGDNYVSSVVLKEKQPEAPNDGLDRRERRKQSRRSYHGEESHARQPYNKRRSTVQPAHSWSEKKPLEGNQKLHPSWAAKKKLNSGPVEFKGRKINFDEESTEQSLSKSSEKSSKNRKPSSKSSDQSTENLHPSWAAKQKIKPTITEFKGTKITFDD